jgi:PAS domain S-box-containing protein
MENDDTPLLTATLHHISSNTSHRHVASTPQASPPDAPDGPFTLRAPAFAFGQPFIIRVDAGALFHQLYPARAGLRTLLIGLVLSGLIAALYRAMHARRQALETEVQDRTAALWQSEQSYRRLFNTITQAIYILDDQLRYIDVNEGACAMYDYQREEFIGRGIDFLSAPNRNTHLDIPAIITRVMAGETVYLEYWGRRKNGEEFPKELWVTRGTYFGSEVFIVVANEISDRKKGETERERLNAQIVQAQKMESVGRLAGGVAHDFNNMLQAIIGNALLARQQIDPHHPSHELLAEIEASAQRSAALTRQLLAFASRQTIQPRIVDLNAIVSGILKMLHRLIGENIHLEWKPATGLWPVKIDPGQIDQILANLVVNARDAIASVGSITIATTNYTCDSATCHLHGFECRPGSYVLLTVTDDGAGMDQETLSHVFEPFFTTKSEGKGTGLGLATVFGIVHQNNGLITIDSRPGQGTTVKILLPRREESAQPEPANPPRPADSTLNGSETILLVEDEPALLRMGQVALERLGYRVLAAPSPADALRIAGAFEGPIDLLVTDVILPGMNGRDLALQLASLHPDTQCLFMSGYTADVISDRGVLSEQMHFLQKPFTISDLASTIRTILAARRSPSA